MSKKSGNKVKWIIPFAVLSFTCAAAGVMVGCDNSNPNDHVHAYEWKYTEGGNEHWKECPEDNTEEEGSRAEHVFVAGECECGAKETVAEKKYGTVSGTIKLHKLGAYDTDFSNVTIDMGDDVDPVLDKSTGNFTVENVVVGKTYTLTVSKPGYQSYKVSVQSEENKNSVIGGQRGIVLEYEVFGLLAGYDEEYHDFSQVNEAKPYLVFKENDGTKTLNVLTSDGYTEVAASMRIEYNNSLHNMHTQGIILRFEDGKHLIVRYHNGDQVNGNIQYVNEAWAPCPKANTLFGEDAKLDQYGEAPVHHLTSEETAAIKAQDGGLDLTLVLKGGKMTVLFDGKYVSEYQLPEGYEDKKVHVGYFAWNTKSNAMFTYGITEELPAMQTSLDIDVTQPEGANCTVTATPQKEKYAFGEQVELALSVPDGYRLDTLTVNGEDKFNSLTDGKLTLTCDREEITVQATFAEKEEMALNLTVKGKKLGVTSTLAKDTEVTLSGIAQKFTVNADGKITADVIIKGRYTVSADGYISKEVLINEELTEIVLEYDSLRTLMGWNPFDNSKQNDNEISGATNDCGIILTNDSYDDVAVSIFTKGSGFTSGSLAVMFRFSDDNGMSDGYAIRLTRGEFVEVYGDVFWEGDTGISKIEGNNWSTLRALTDAEKELYANGELKFTVLRKGASFYCFLGNDFIGCRTLADKYAGIKAEAGFLFDGANKDSKGWKFEITDDASEFPELGVAITNGTAEDAHGTISITSQIILGDTVTVTVTPESGYLLDNLTVSGGITPEKIEENKFTFVATQRQHTVTATFVEKGQIESVKFTVGEWKAEGLEFTLTREGGEKITGTITDGEFVATDVEKGDWTLTTEIFGTTVNLNIEVLSEEVELDFSSLFVNAAQAKANIDLVEGNVTYHGNIKEDLAVLTNISGSAWFVGKISVSQADFEKVMSGSQVSLGMYISFSDGTYKFTGWNIANKKGDMHLCVTDSDWWENGHTGGDGCDTKLGKINKDNTYTLSKYREALFGGSGLYYIINYDETTGYLSVYYATGSDDVVLVREMAHNSKKGTISKFGINCGINWGDAAVTFNISDFRYSATLGGYFGVPEQEITVTGIDQLENGTVEVTNAYTGNDVVIKVTPDEGYKLVSLKVGKRK